MSKIVDLNNIYVGTVMEMEYDPFFDEGILIDASISLFEDTGCYLSVDNLKQSAEFKKQGIKNSNVKIHRYFNNLMTDKMMRLTLRINRYPHIIEYDSDDGVIRTLISIKEMMDNYFDNVELTNYEEYYYREFIDEFSNRNKVNIEQLYEYYDQICDLYDDYVSFVCTPSEEMIDKEDSARIIDLNKYKNVEFKHNQKHK